MPEIDYNIGAATISEYFSVIFKVVGPGYEYDVPAEFCDNGSFDGSYNMTKWGNNSICPRKDFSL